ncbi:MAG: type II secretion system F family protein [Planctomycetaceae bacterium]|nr:type II secretion system F family protein [Planctomycetaceae bacterium]
MSPTVVALIAFVAASSMALALGMVIREWVIAGRGTETRPGSLRLKRRRDVFDQAAPSDVFGQLDQGFDRLVLESGSDIAPFNAFLLMVAVALISGGTAWLYTDEPLGGIAAALAGFGAPLLWFFVQRARRLRAIREQLPHVVDLLARATRAGRSIEQSLALVASEAGGVLGKEFQRCEQQLSMGRGFDTTLKAFAGRIRLMEMQILATTLIVQRQSGGHLSETLDRMTVVIRDRLNAQRQVRASTAAGRMSTLIVASIAPLAVVFLFAFQREHLNALFDDALGRSMLLVAIVLELIGLVWVALLLREEH